MTTPTPDPPTREHLIDATVKWTSALLDSASSDEIGPANWWPRATSALVTASGASTIGEAVTTAARKLQVDVAAPHADAELLAASDIIAQDYPAWAQLVDREAVYLIALTRVYRNARKAARKATA